MRILVACEFSGVVREQLTLAGHDAWSCDLLPTELPGKHLRGDVLQFLNGGWDGLIAHPPCTRLCVSGARWFKDHKQEQKDAVEFFMKFVDCNIPKKAIENPIGIMSTIYRKPDQIIQPWMFGHGEVKATCLWLQNLDVLAPSNIVSGREPKIHWASPGPDRSKNRSRTYLGIAKAIAKQWFI